MQDHGTSPLILAVYASAQQQNFGHYDKPLGQSLWPSYLRQPRAAGESIYQGLSDTAFRVTGADPGYSDRTAQDVPQSAIRANHDSFRRGLVLFFPDTEVAAYVAAQLALPAFASGYGSPRQTYTDALQQHLPRTTQQGKLKLEQCADYRFRYSLEHDFTAAGVLTANIADPSRRAANRAVLTDDELRRAYLYSCQHPELWAALMLWQNSIGAYALEMRRHHYITRNGMAIPRTADILTTFLAFVEGVLTHNPVFQLMLIPHIVEYARLMTAQKDVSQIGATDMVQAVRLARTNGIFRRVFSTADGERHVVCPAGAHVTRWLTQGLNHGGDDADSSLFRCYQKILAEKDSNPSLRAMCGHISEVMHRLVTEDGLSPVAKHPSAAASHSVGCPFHQGNG